MDGWYFSCWSEEYAGPGQAALNQPARSESEQSVSLVSTKVLELSSHPGAFNLSQVPGTHNLAVGKLFV